MAEQAGDLARSEMPLLDHLVELRTRLLWCVAWFVLAFGVCMFFATDIFAFLLWPLSKRRMAKPITADLHRTA